MGIVMMVLVVSALVNGAKAADVMAGCLCTGTFGAVPLGILVASRRRSRGPRRRTDLVKNQGSAPAGHVNVEITADETLPRLCACCGAETRRVSKFQYHGAHTPGNPYDWSRVHPLLMIFLVWKFGAQLIMAKLVTIFERFRDRRRARNEGMVFRIPHCRDCKRHRPIVQCHFDFHGRRLPIVAPATFGARLVETRKSAPRPRW